jgi:hypothetical protein
MTQIPACLTMRQGWSPAKLGTTRKSRRNKLRIGAARYCGSNVMPRGAWSQATGCVYPASTISETSSLGLCSRQQVRIASTFNASGFFCPEWLRPGEHSPLAPLVISDGFCSGCAIRVSPRLVNTQNSTGVRSADLLPVIPPANSPLLGSQVEFRFSFRLREESKGSEPAESCGRQRASPNVCGGQSSIEQNSSHHQAEDDRREQQ